MIAQIENKKAFSRFLRGVNMTTHNVPYLDREKAIKDNAIKIKCTFVSKTGNESIKN